MTLQEALDKSIEIKGLSHKETLKISQLRDKEIVKEQIKLNQRKKMEG